MIELIKNLNAYKSISNSSYINVLTKFFWDYSWTTVFEKLDANSGENGV
jgi:hypothetical protein